MKKCRLAGLMKQYKKLPVTMKMWLQFNVMPRTVSNPESQSFETTKPCSFGVEKCVVGELRILTVSVLQTALQLAKENS